jgi:hypothetical protein
LAGRVEELAHALDADPNDLGGRVRVLHSHLN